MRPAAEWPRANNARRHGERLDPRWNGIDPFSSAWHFAGWSHDRWRRGLDPPEGEPPVTPAETWLLAEGWLRHGRVRPDELPAHARAIAATREQWLGMTE